MQLFLDIHRSYAGRSKNLVTGKDEEVTTERLHVCWKMSDRLGAIDQDAGSISFGHLRHFVHGQDRS